MLASMIYQAERHLSTSTDGDLASHDSRESNSQEGDVSDQKVEGANEERKFWMLERAVVIIRVAHSSVNHSGLVFKRENGVCQRRVAHWRMAQISRLHQYSPNPPMPQVQERVLPMPDFFDR
jgi:hypothetical protein